ncbi:hypothetical protein EEO84_24560 [Salmonella enterica]|nr:hypothetical protein [Salmonella enterica]ELQ5732487.1 hypothetical protein [Salmonella enterica]MFW68012.1 hypothetical protein [Salmonella enterica]HCI9882705.1 hypothetical protein [Salmonella enterica subsp. enterica serovar Infantis]
MNSKGDFMNIVTKTTQNYAKARQLILDSDFCDENKQPFLWVCVDDDSSEPMFSLFANDDGSFSYKGNIWLSDATREEIPAFIRDEKHLRSVLAFVAQDMKPQIAECFS